MVVVVVGATVGATAASVVVGEGTVVSTTVDTVPVGADIEVSTPEPEALHAATSSDPPAITRINVIIGSPWLVGIEASLQRTDAPVLPYPDAPGTGRCRSFENRRGR